RTIWGHSRWWRYTRLMTVSPSWVGMARTIPKRHSPAAPRRASPIVNSRSGTPQLPGSSRAIPPKTSSTASAERRATSGPRRGRNTAYGSLLLTLTAYGRGRSPAAAGDPDLRCGGLLHPAGLQPDHEAPDHQGAVDQEHHGGGVVTAVPQQRNPHQVHGDPHQPEVVPAPGHGVG